MSDNDTTTTSSTPSNSSSNLPIKHPSLRPRIFDPFSRSNATNFLTTLRGDIRPGAVAIRGPSARRDGNDDDDIDEDDDIEDDSHHQQHDNNDEENVVVATIDGFINDAECCFPSSHETLTSSDDDESEQHVRESYNHRYRVGRGTAARSNKNNNNKKKKKKRFGSGSFAMFAMVVGVVATGLVVVALTLGVVYAEPGGRSSSSSDDASSSSSTPNDNEKKSKDWCMVTEIIGHVDSFGYKVDFNAEATLMAVAAPMAHDTRGQVQVYRRNTHTLSKYTTKEDWDRLGEPILGKRNGDFASLGMDLSMDGIHLAIGYPGSTLNTGVVRVFHFDNVEWKWKQQGQTIRPPTSDDTSSQILFGTSVAMNQNGTFLVVGAPQAGKKNEGMIQAYKWSSLQNLWIEYANPRYGLENGDSFGQSVEMTLNGDAILVGAPGDDTKWEDGGRVYYLEIQKQVQKSSTNNNTTAARQNDEDVCTQSSNSCYWNDRIHPAVTGEATGSHVGQSLALQPEGHRFIASSITYNEEDVESSSSSGYIAYKTKEEENDQVEDLFDGQDNEEQSNNIGIGKVRVLTIDPFVSTVADVGFGILGTNPKQGLGYDVAINSGTDIILATTSVNNANKTGVVRAYKFGVAGRLDPLGTNIGGQLSLGSGMWYGHSTSGDYAGPSISFMSPRVAVGYQSVVLPPTGDDDDQEKEVPGVVRIFHYQ